MDAVPFVKHQTLIFRPNGQKAFVVGTPDEFVLNDEFRTPVYGIRFYVSTPEGYTEDKNVVIVEKKIVEEHFRIPDANETESDQPETVQQTDLPFEVEEPLTFWQRMHKRLVRFALNLG